MRFFILYVVNAIYVTKLSPNMARELFTLISIKSGEATLTLDTQHFLHNFFVVLINNRTFVPDFTPMMSLETLGMSEWQRPRLCGVHIWIGVYMTLCSRLLET